MALPYKPSRAERQVKLHKASAFPPNFRAATADKAGEKLLLGITAGRQIPMVQPPKTTWTATDEDCGKP